MFAAKQVMKGSIKSQANFSLVGQMRKSMFELMNRNDSNDPHYQVCMLDPKVPLSNTSS
jgi:hypothetical protein